MQLTSTGGYQFVNSENHIIKLVDILKSCRINSSSEFSVTFAKTRKITKELDIEMNLPKN